MQYAISNTSKCFNMHPYYLTYYYTPKPYEWVTSSFWLDVFNSFRVKVLYSKK